MKKILVIIFLILSTSVLSANERDTKLDKLFLELKKNIMAENKNNKKNNIQHRSC